MKALNRFADAYWNFFLWLGHWSLMLTSPEYREQRRTIARMKDELCFMQWEYGRVIEIFDEYVLLTARRLSPDYRPSYRLPLPAHLQGGESA